jgi:hypothetical protein
MRLRHSNNLGILYFWNQFHYFRDRGEYQSEESEAIREIENELFKKAEEY